MKTVEELEKEIDLLEYLYDLLDKAKGKKECINERFH